jgi:hypothetical protein
MAARVLVLSFKSEKAAEQFAHLKIQWENTDTEPTDNIEAEILTLGAIVAAETTLEAMVAKPSNPCRCTSSKHVNRGGGYTKTVKFGWWVHAACGKPEWRVIQDFIKNMIISSGNDLLPALKDTLKAEREPAEPEGTETDASADAQGQTSQVDEARLPG